MPNAKILVLSGLGLNCEAETKFAFECAAESIGHDIECHILHINDLTEDNLFSCHVLAIPGGFSYGDKTGAGNAFAIKMQSQLNSTILDFVNRGGAVIGICNGCQILSKILNVNFAFLKNLSNTYQCEWVDLVVTNHENIWLKNLEKIRLPIAHEEGRMSIDGEESGDSSMSGGFYMPIKYYGVNPNGSQNAAAGFSDATGRILGMMPHPERAILTTQSENWTKEREILKRSNGQNFDMPKYTIALEIFKNGLKYVQQTQNKTFE